MSKKPYGVILTVRIDPFIKKALTAIAKNSDLTVTQVVRKALKNLIAKEY